MILELNNINLTYDEKILLEDAHLQCNSKIIKLTGRNGCGKTTLLNAIYNCTYDGEISINENNFEDIKVCRQVISYIPQFGKFVDFATVKYHFKLIKADCNRAINLIHTFDDTIKLNSRINKLSGGQKQIVNIVLGLMKKSEFLMVDEPFNNLSEKNIAILENIFQNESRSMIIVTHKDLNLPYTEVRIERRNFLCKN